MSDQREPAASVHGHGGHHVVAAARVHGVRSLFTLSGAHVFPVYDAAAGGQSAVEAAASPRAAEESSIPRLIDVRHEATAAFAAEATGRLTRVPGLAVVTAGPGVTNTVTALTAACFNGAPMVVLGGRAPDYRAGTGALQELDQPPLVASVTKSASTVHDAALICRSVDEAFSTARSAHRGPVFLDIPMDVLFQESTAPAPLGPTKRADRTPDPDAVSHAAHLLSSARKPVLIISTDVWTDGAEEHALRFVETTGIPVVCTGSGRGVVPRGHRLLVTRARSHALAGADLVVVAGAPLDFRLAYGRFGDPAAPTPILHLVDADEQRARHPTGVVGEIVGELTLVFDALLDAWPHSPRTPEVVAWADELHAQDRRSREADEALLQCDTELIHPARVFGELVPRLTDDTVVIGDGGDFVSFAGRYIEPARPGRWLDPGPYGALGSGLGYAIAACLAHPGSPVVLLLGDGAAGFSLMDIDSLVRHRLPVTIVVGNNSAWGLEKHPMRMLYGYDILADLNPAARYDKVAAALGAGGERVEQANGIGPALDRALGSGIPYLVDIATDPDATYPRSTTGI